MTDAFDLVVIGGGPAGYVASIRAAQLGMSVACIEKEPSLGGTCLRVGCIPSKALLDSSHHYDFAKNHLADHGIVAKGDFKLDLATMLARKDRIVDGLGKGVGELFKKNKVTRFDGTGSLAGVGKVVVKSAAGSKELSAKHILISTGSKPASLRGVEFDGDRIGTSTEALKYSKVPAELIVIGAGAIGLELGSVWSRLGSKVTVVEYLDRILPEMDAEVAQATMRVFKKQGLEFQLSSRVTSVRVENGKSVVETEGHPPLRAERVLVAVGRVPYTDGLNLEAVGLKADERGRIPVDDHFQTSVAGIYAVGDCIRGPMLAHKAEEEGVACVEYLATGYGHVNYDVIPSIVYTNPEVASVGKTEEQLRKEGRAIKKGVFAFRANSRARVIDEVDGFVKILADASTDRVLGVHILHARAGDLIAEAAIAMETGCSSEDIARTCHAHPTLPEAIKEAALAVDNRAIHS